MWHPVALLFGACALLGAGLGSVLYATTGAGGTSAAAPAVSAPLAGVPTPAAPAIVATAAPTAQATASSESRRVTVDLGTRPFAFGTQGQATELLALVRQQPGKDRYTITYRTTVDVVVFGCDLTSGTVVRVHHEYSGREKSETWTGYVMDRLQGGAAGRSLNDTPAGKSFAREEGF
jgi:hypothetical protein